MRNVGYWLLKLEKFFGYCVALGLGIMFLVVILTVFDKLHPTLRHIYTCICIGYVGISLINKLLK